MKAVLPADQPVRQRLLEEMDTNFFAEAGAGTGKTTALVSRIVELVAQDKLQMERLAAITFTEAAAAELRNRIRQDLEKAAISRVRDVERERCARGSRQVDLAAVQTIHAFAGALLRRFPLEAGLPPDFSILDEIEQERLFGDRYRTWLYDQVPDETCPERRATVRRVLALGMRPNQLRDLASSLQDYRDLITPTTDWPTATPEDPVVVANSWGARLVTDAAAAAHQAFDQSDKLAIELRRLRAIAERMASVQDEDLALRLMQECDPKTQGGNQSNWPPGRCKELKGILSACASALASAVQHHRATALADLLLYLRDFTVSFANDRKRDGTATFHDLLTWARDLLRDNPDVRRRAQDRFDRLFIDEFQDTDPLQVEIAWFLTSEPAQAEERDWRGLRLKKGKMFIVGDPKQSIYRFRRADIGIFDDVYGSLDNPSDRVVLSQSFRSPDSLIDWFNHHFSDDMQRLDRVQPAYQPLNPRPSDGIAGNFGVSHAGRFTDSAGERWQEEARTVARLAHEIVNGATPWAVTDRGSPTARPARFSDICVLIPTRTNLRRLERAFQREDLPYRMESGWLVLHTQEVRDLLSCLRAIDDPSDQVALVAALRSPAYACSDVDLLRWVDGGGRFDYERPGSGGGGPVHQAFASLRVFHLRRLHQTPAALTEIFIRDRMLTIQAFGDRHPRDALRRLRYVVAQARTLASSGPSTLRALCDWLESRQREQYYDAESPVPDADEDAVRFMTVHGSKGLEFPIVILTGLGVATTRAGPPSVDLVPDYTSHALRIRCGDFLTEGYDGSTEKAMYEAEQRRLLYVATTRARDHLVLSLFRGKEPCHASRIVSRLISRPELSRELTLAPRAPAAASPSARIAPTGLTPEQHRADEEPWLAHRRSLIQSLSIQAVVAPSSLAHEPDPPPEPDPNNAVRHTRRGRGGSALGRAVHAVLQTIDLTTLARLDTLSTAAAQDEEIPELVPTVALYVQNAAASAPVQRALGTGRYWREVPVGVLRDDGAIVEGAIDLLFENADGTLGVVDYKTDQITAGQAAARAEVHRAQGEAYAQAVAQVTGRSVTSLEFVFAALG